jgi:3-hydroxyisobutyrate dehydrogenase-like beta-hydroxyacid dehydrogenase
VLFTVSLARKDVDLAIDLAAELAVPIPQAQLNLEQL